MLTAQVGLAELGDQALLALIAAGSEEALGALYDRYGRLAYAVALRVTHDPQTAEEVVQDVFAVVWRIAAGYGAEYRRAAPWLLAITRNQAINTLRSRRERSRGRELHFSAHHEVADLASEDPIDPVLLRAAVRAALAELPAAQRQAIEQMYFDGLSSTEIAARQDVPLGTVKTRLRLGMLKLHMRLRSWVATLD